jgi:alanyl-tRNA synthetase
VTDRLYYVEPGAQEFDATVVSVERRDGRAVVKLDRTAFYPTSGGQPFDTGALGGASVIDVYDEADSPE